MSEDPKSVLIVGESGAGKSACLRNMRGQEGVLYINCEGGKPLPFKNKFKRVTIDDPYEIFDLYQQIQDNPGRFHTIVVDTVSFMMDRFESVHVVGSANGMAAWGAYGQFFKTLMYDHVAKPSSLATRSCWATLMRSSTRTLGSFPTLFLSKVL